MFSNLTSFSGGLFDEFERLEREMDRLFGQMGGPSSIRAVARGSFPQINIGTTPDAVLIYAFAPGLDPDSLDISVNQNLLTIAGERKLESPAPADDVNVYLRERYSGEFKRVVSLTDDVDPDRLEASYSDGILKIIASKRESAVPRRIEIH